MSAQAFGLDSAQVRRAFERAAAAGREAAVPQRGAGRRRSERRGTTRCRPHPAPLTGLHAAFGAGSAARDVHSIMDMHDLGDMLVASGFAAPVMDMEVITLTYSEVLALLRDLKASGETCAARDRQRGLMGRRAWERMLASYERERRAGRLPATIEVIYGHAWKGEPGTTGPGRRIIKVELGTRP